MKKVANFIVNKHKLVLLLMLVITILCGVLISKVEINTDMTKYLPDKSSMAQGVELMKENFDNMSTTQTIRVMFKDLDEKQISEIKEDLAAIPNVSSVSYVAGSEDYNKDGYTKFVVNTSFTYGSPEEVAIEKAIEDKYESLNVELMNDNTSTMELPWVVIAVALVLLLIILFVMCGSWFEPVLFLLTIGIAVVINMGTNLVLGSVSQITMSIAAILQLVLSMDYSIILMNRYRQEKMNCEDKNEAMKIAWQGAMSSVMSSGMTTVIGLIMLVFMSFKIGMDLGIVLAKGVFLSMVCVLTVLPALILIFDKVITKTEKKEVHVPMGFLSRTEYKARKPIAILFVVLFIVSFFTQNLSKTVYSLSPEDPIADIFTPSNPIVVLYNNKDEEKVTKLALDIEKDENVKSVMSYSTTLGRDVTAQGLADMVGKMGMDMSIDPSLLNVVYYSYFDGTLLPMTASDILKLISDEIAPNPMFSNFINDDMKESIGLLKSFSNPDELTKEKTPAELADAFGMSEDEIEQLFVLYYSGNPGADYGTMTMPQFADFIVNEVANNPQYSSMFDAETKEQLSMLTTFTDKKAVTEKRTYQSMAQLLGIDEEYALFLYCYHYEYLRNPKNVNYDQVVTNYAAWHIVQCPHEMTVQELLNFVSANKRTIKNLASKIDGGEEMVKDLDKLEMGKNVVNATVSEKSYTPTQMANIMELDASQVKQLYLLYITQNGDTSSWKASIESLISFIASDVLTNEMYESFFDDNTASLLQSADLIVKAVISGETYTVEEMTEMLSGISEDINLNTVKLLYLFNAGLKNSNDEWTLTIVELFRYISEEFIEDYNLDELLGEKAVAEIKGMKTQLDDGINQLVGKNYSIMMIETSLPAESVETSAFIKNSLDTFENNLDDEVYLIGNSPMNYEMEQSFDTEFLLITILTAVAIFIVVMLTFRSLLIPAALVLLVQCGVFLTMTVNGLLGYSMYYLAVLIVQCILMGATIDYGILFTNYYRENRKTMDIKGALLSAYNGSIHTILTSGLIIVLVTGAIGMSPVDPTIAQICRVISIGALTAILLILFVLPGLIATCDRFVTKSRKERKQEKAEQPEN